MFSFFQEAKIKKSKKIMAPETHRAVAQEIGCVSAGTPGCRRLSRFMRGEHDREISFRMFRVADRFEAGGLQFFVFMPRFVPLGWQNGA